MTEHFFEPPEGRIVVIPLLVSHVAFLLADIRDELKKAGTEKMKPTAVAMEQIAA